jgi:hypothetical protein
VPIPGAASDAAAKILHLVEDAMNLRNNVLSVDNDRRLSWSAQGDVQNGTIFGDVDPFTLEHRVDPSSQAGLLSQLKEERERLRCNSILRVIEVETDSVYGETLTARGVIREQITKM